MSVLKKLLVGILLMTYSLTSSSQRMPSSNGAYVTVDGVKMYYESVGKGKPLILLHTFFGTVEQWGTYRDELSSQFNVISVDLPGHGRSDFMDTTVVYDNTRAARYVIGLLEQLNIDSAYFWGASTGGTITLKIASLRPRLVSKMIVLGAQLYYSTKTRDWLRERGLKSPDEDGINDHGLKKAVLLEKQFYHYADMYDELNITPDVLNRFTAKTMIVSGDNDFAAPFLVNALQMYQAIPDAQLWVVPNGSHLPHLDDGNHSEFLRTVKEFLNN
jgi:pimeloyl-ACP methyl ester carboxylesterase